MKVLLNDQELEVAPDQSVAGMLQVLDIQNQAGIAIAINGEVIASCDWQSTCLKHSDRILLIEAIQGG